MSLHLDLNTFKVKSATLTGILPDPYWCETYNSNQGKDLYWYLAVETYCRRIKGETVHPSLCLQSIPVKTRSWKPFENRTIVWGLECGTESNPPDCALCLEECERVTSGILQFLERTGTAFKVIWNGETELSKTFTLATTVKLKGIEVRGNEHDTDAAIRRRLEAFAEPNEYIQQPMKVSDFRYDSGLRTAQAVFAPKP